MPGYGDTFTCPFHNFRPVSNKTAMISHIESTLRKYNLKVELQYVVRVDAFSPGKTPGARPGLRLAREPQ